MTNPRLPSLLFGMVFSYLLGSIPTGYCMAKGLKGIDIREHGSGNPGATNVFRVVGKLPGIFTLLIDGLKGFLPVWLALKYDPHNIIFASILGLSAISGHNWTIFLNFKGGKGVATSAGVFLALVPVPSLIAFGFFLIGLLASRHVSIGSMSGAVSLCISTWIFTYSKYLTFLSLFCALLIIYLHRKNINRLLHNEEPKIEWKKSAS